MAARWGTGEEMLTACKLECFTPTALDESEILQEGLYSLQHSGLDTGDALEALHGCLDPSILSIFEDSTNEEVKSGIDDESEATLLTALTEILDNVDEENLSPFDTLPDMELLQKAQKGREHSPLRRLLSLSCTPPERESMCNSKQFSRKRHDGGEDAAASFSKLIQDLDVSSELDWCLPISLEQDGETVSVTLSDLVKHMHPYAMTLCVEGEEQLLPEGGIILEVMDKGEHGEPILSIPDLSFPLSLNSLDDEQSVPESIPENIREHEDPDSEVVLSEVSPVRDDKLENGKIKHLRREPPKKRHSKKKKKWKIEEPKPVKRLVLRSMSHKDAIKEEPSKEREAKKHKKKVTFAPTVLAVHENKNSHVISSETKPTKVQESLEILSSTTANLSSQDCTKAIESQLLVPEEKPAPSESSNNNCREITASSEQQSEVSQPSEPKQKSLSLQQYRLLRQQKKLCPVEKVGDNSTKWPTLQEAPKELPPIPCLPEPNPKDPRRAAPTPLKNESVLEIMPAWNPRGPGAPPTPQALLVPPESMLAASKKESCKSVSPPPTKPAENLARSTSFSTQPCPPKLPIPSHMATNTIPQAAKQTSSEITPSIPMATTVRETLVFSAADKEKSLQNTPSALHQATVSQLPAFSKDQEISHAQVVPEIILVTTKPDAANAAPNNLNAVRVADELVKASVLKPAKPTQSISATKPTVRSQRNVAAIALQPFASAPIQARIMKLAEQMRMASAAAPKERSPSADLIQAFTSEIGIEASDLTSLLEQFEETQTKEEQNMPAVCGRAAAVGNSRAVQHGETTVLRKACSPDLGSTAGLTPPATPPQQMWKPLAPVTLLEKPSKSELAKSTTTKAIQIEPLPLRASKLQNKTQNTVTIGQIQPFSLEHDYCLLEPSQNELGNLCPAKQEQNIIKTTVLPSANSKAAAETESKLSSTITTKESFQKNVKTQPPVCAGHSKKEVLATTVLVTPDASPDRLESESFQGYSERCVSPCHQKRGRTQRKYRTRVPSRSRSTSSSSGSSRSRSPPRKRCRSSSTSRSSSRHRTRSRSSSPHQRRYSCSSSDSWSRSRSRSRSHSRSPPRRSHHWDTRPSSTLRSNYYDLKHHNEEIGRRKEKAIEERRVVYIGRIHGSMTRNELRDRFSYFGDIEECTVHFREHGDNYGFVTYYNNKDAFNAIENGSKLRQPNELPFDLCFGGRRQFCKSSYADLDSNRDHEPVTAKARVSALDFDTLLKQAQRNLKR